MHRHNVMALGLLVVALVLTAGCSDKDAGAPHVSGSDRVAAGKYIIEIGGCNDCHTPGWAEGQKVSEDKLLTGVPLGWRGPWGTSYAQNLRLTAKSMSMEDFSRTMSVRSEAPPMPWSALHALTKDDLDAVYMYLAHLGPAGERMPVRLPPGMEPTTPYIELTPRMPAAQP